MDHDVLEAAEQVLMMLLAPRKGAEGWGCLHRCSFVGAGVAVVQGPRRWKRKWQSCLLLGVADEKTSHYAAVVVAAGPLLRQLFEEAVVAWQEREQQQVPVFSLAVEGLLHLPLPLLLQPYQQLPF